MLHSKGRFPTLSGSPAINLYMSALGELPALLTGVQMLRCQRPKPCESGVLFCQDSLQAPIYARSLITKGLV